MHVNTDFDSENFSPHNKDYETIRSAIKSGMNYGHYGSSLEKEIIHYTWRLMGDFIEIMKEREDVWKPIAPSDIDFRHRMGVFGTFKNTNFYPDASVRVSRTSARKTRVDNVKQSNSGRK